MDSVYNYYFSRLKKNEKNKVGSFMNISDSFDFHKSRHKTKFLWSVFSSRVLNYCGENQNVENYESSIQKSSLKRRAFRKETKSPVIQSKQKSSTEIVENIFVKGSKYDSEDQNSTFFLALKKFQDEQKKSLLLKYFQEQNQNLKRKKKGKYLLRIGNSEQKSLNEDLNYEKLLTMKDYNKGIRPKSCCCKKCGSRVAKLKCSDNLQIAFKRTKLTKARETFKFALNSNKTKALMIIRRMSRIPEQSLKSRASYESTLNPHENDLRSINMTTRKISQLIKRAESRKRSQKEENKLKLDLEKIKESDCQKGKITETQSSRSKRRKASTKKTITLTTIRASQRNGRTKLTAQDEYETLHLATKRSPKLQNIISGIEKNLKKEKEKKERFDVSRFLKSKKAKTDSSVGYEMLTSRTIISHF